MQACGFLEMHVADGCNLACESCSHFANYLSKGDNLLSPADAQSQMEAWSARLSPRIFTMFGGEPCLNPGLPQIVTLASRCWPTARRQIMSNGILLGSVPGLADALAASGTELVITRHSPDMHMDLGLLKNFMAAGIIVSLICADGNPVPAGFNGIVRTKQWTRRYADADGKPVPIVGEDPNATWATCPCRGFLQLRDGLLYKCPTVAYLPTVQAKLGPLDHGWKPALSYVPLGPDCSEDELSAFLSERSNPACAACALNPLPLAPSLTRR